jgi:hypothetical protein
MGFEKTSGRAEKNVEFSLERCSSGGGLKANPLEK